MPAMISLFSMIYVEGLPNWERQDVNIYEK